MTSSSSLIYFVSFWSSFPVLCVVSMAPRSLATFHSSLALFSAQLGKLVQNAIKPANETNKPTVVYSVEWIASINPNIISAKPHKLFINNK